MIERRKRHPLGVAAAIVVLGAAATAMVGTLMAVVMARRVVTPPQLRTEDVEVERVDLADDLIDLRRTDESVMRGRYSFWFAGGAGHARLGDVVAIDDATVRRRIEQLDFGDLGTAHRGRFSGWFFLGPWELGGFEHVSIPTEFGPAPGWFLPAEGSDGDWIVQVHGWGGRRQEGLRAVGAARAAGWNSLLISYRNDGEAPDSEDRRYGLGTTEWHDVAAAVAFARANGAKRIVLMGWSMGGQIVLQTVLRDAATRESVVGIILDSPAIDWSDILRFQGRANGLPDGIGVAVAHLLASPLSGGLAGVSVPIDLRALDIVARADEFDQPILLMHSVDDGFVPIEGSARFAAARPDLVEFAEFTEARHAKLWNHDADRWERLIIDALTRWAGASD